MAPLTKKALRQVSTFLTIGLLLGTAVEAETAEGYSSPLACVPAKDGRTLYIAETGADRVTAFDIQEERVDKSFPMPDSPSGLAASSDGRFLYATCGVSDGRVLAVDLANGKIVLDLRVGHTPTSPVAGPDGKTLYVCNRFTNDVSIVDLTAGKEVKRVAVEREPSAAALTPDGASLFVANDLPAGAADSDYVAAAVSVIDTKSLEVTATIRLHNGSTGLRGVCVAPDGLHAYVTHILSRYPVPTTQLDRGWINTNALSVIDVAGQRLLNTVLLDDVDAGAANPWGVSCTPGGEFICVAHAGTHEVSVIDRAKLHDRLARVAAGQQVTDV
jgi:YVTN family beta-propeller protein